MRRAPAVPSESGWHVIGEVRAYFRSRWESNYARWLEFLRTNGSIARWEHEPETFWFDGIRRGVCSYLPDFRVTRPNGAVEYHEVKGWMDPRSKTKLKRMAKYHPGVALVVIDKSQYARLSRDVGPIVPGWQRGPRQTGPARSGSRGRIAPWPARKP